MDMKVADAFVKGIAKGDSALIKYYMNNQMGFVEKAATINVENNLTLQAIPIPEFNRLMAEVATRPAPASGKIIEQDGSLLPAPVCAEPS